LASLDSGFGSCTPDASFDRRSFNGVLLTSSISSSFFSAETGFLQPMETENSESEHSFMETENRDSEHSFSSSWLS
jgi:hypothetical protein